MFGKLGRYAEQWFSAALSLGVVLVVLSFILRSAAKYAPANVSKVITSIADYGSDFTGSPFDV